MLQNPFLTPPQVESPKSRSWGRGFAFGFNGPPESVEPGTDFPAEDLDAFEQGVLAGQTAAIEGLQFFENPCVDLHREAPPDWPELAWSGLDAWSVLRDLGEIAKKGMGGAIFGAVATFIDLSIALQTHFDDPEAALEDHARRLQQLFGEMETTSGVELFIGGAVDTNKRNCELQITPVFRNMDSAVSAAKAIGRPGPVLAVRWRTDQSGGAEVVFSE